MSIVIKMFNALDAHDIDEIAKIPALQIYVFQSL